MDSKIAAKIMLTNIKYNENTKVTVTGTSMNPILYEGDIISVKAQESYVPGDILVFIYRDSDLLVHRLIDIQGNFYCCKGDNSYRLEYVRRRNIIGRVESYIREGIDHTIKPCSKRLLILSKAVGEKAVRLLYNDGAINSTPLHKLYKQVVEDEDNKLVIYRNKPGNVQEIGTGRNDDYPSISISEILDEPMEYEQLVSIITDKYNITRNDADKEIRQAVLREFIEII